MAFNFKKIVKTVLNSSSRKISETSKNEINRRAFAQFMISQGDEQGWNLMDRYYVSASSQTDDKYVVEISLNHLRMDAKVVTFYIENDGKFIAKRVDGIEFDGNIFRLIAVDELEKVREDITNPAFAIVTPEIFENAVRTLENDADTEISESNYFDDKDGIISHFHRIDKNGETYFYEYHLRSNTITTEKYDKVKEDFFPEENEDKKIALKLLVWKQLYPNMFNDNYEY